MKDTFLQFSDTNKGKKKELVLKAYGVFTENLKGSTLLSDSEECMKVVRDLPTQVDLNVSMTERMLTLGMYNSQSTFTRYG